MGESVQINSGNFSSQMENCQKLLESANQADFSKLYDNLDKFQSSSKSDNISQQWNDFNQKVIKRLMKYVEEAENFETFVSFLRLLKKAVQDPATLWKIVHTSINSQLKVTMHESQLIATEFFTPEELFEFGFDQFTESNLCEFKNITNDEALIDIFYAVVGFERACNLSKMYIAKIPQYANFITKILQMFIALQDFDAQRFVWLIEVINQHLHLESSKLREICEEIINGYVNGNSEKNSLNKLYKLCVISTSPFLHSMKEIPETINTIFQQVLEDQRLFLRKYILCNFIMCDWSSQAPANYSDAYKCWKLYITNIATKLAEKPELPHLLLTDLIEESLLVFEGYYGEVQPTIIRATAMRMDIFGIIETISPYQESLSSNGLKRCWYLLYITAVCGASDFDIANVKPAAKDDTSNTIMLGLDRYGSDFLDYRIALEKLSKKFESEFENFQNMAAFIRHNYKPQQPAEQPPAT